jgi:hypothetical protein
MKARYLAANKQRQRRQRRTINSLSKAHQRQHGGGSGGGIMAAHGARYRNHHTYTHWLRAGACLPATPSGEMTAAAEIPGETTWNG